MQELTNILVFKCTSDSNYFTEASYINLDQTWSILFALKATYGKCSKISNTLKLRTPKIIAENNF